MNSKKAIIIITIILFVSGTLLAQTGDSRILGMANAFTAVADDYNALYFNPAGLAFLDEKDFVLGAGGSAAFTNDFIFGSEGYPDVYEQWDDYSYEYKFYYWDDESGEELLFEPGDYDGFSYGPGQDYPDYDAAVEAYMEQQAFLSIHDFMENISDIQAVPRVSYVAPHWGISSIFNASINPGVGVYEGESTEYSFDVSTDSGIMGGVGLNIGGIGFGANLKYYTRTTDRLISTAAELAEGIPLTESTSDSYDYENAGYASEGEGHLELGIGALIALGTINFGLYSDNILGFAEEEGSFRLDSSFLDTLSVGLALTPFNKKTDRKSGILNFILAGDLKNLGDEENRILALGAEAGLHLGNFLTVDGRIGYTQPLPGSLSTMSESFDPESGLYTFGLGAHFLIFTFNFAIQASADSLMADYEEVPAGMFGRLAIDASLIF